jgi:Flp pilus assembly protein TadG
MKTKREAIKVKKTRRGAALVEAALVLPLFVTVTLGIVEFGRGMMVAQLVTNAAREGARLAMFDGSSNSDVETTIRDFLTDAADVSDGDVSITITIAPAPGNDDPANQVLSAGTRDLITITVSIPFDKVSFVAGDYLNGKSLTGKAVIRHE